MQFVMVPVPEEHAPEVLRYVDRLRSRTLRDPWDADGVAALLAATSEATRSFLTILAGAVSEHRELLHSETASQLAMSSRELDLLMFEITMRTNELRRHNLFGTEPIASTGSHGEDGGSDRRITMPEDVARSVLEATGESTVVDTDRAAGETVDPKR
jgi:hypothetical protein